MALSYQVLGAAGDDNALLVRIDTGQRISRLLFDCGEGCLNALSFGEVQQIDQLFFSHLHMDHIGGFDSFVRTSFNRASPPNQLWGPPQTIEILHHRLRGFMWNLHADLAGVWQISDIYPQSIEQASFLASEAFAQAHPLPARQRGAALLADADWSIDALELDHRTPSLAYLVREQPRRHVEPQRLAALGLRPGPWLNQLKQAAPPSSQLAIQGQTYDHAALSAELITETPGGSIAYLTDALLDAAALARLTPWLQGCQTLICESQYLPADHELALHHHHMTATQAAELARRAGVSELVLFHVSQRYRASEWQAMLDAARRIFPRTSFPAHWQIEAAS